MKIPKALKYVEQMRNIGYLTGYVRHINKLDKETWHCRQITDSNVFLLQQTKNIEQAIPIYLPEGVPLPADKSPVTIAIHAFGFTDPITGEQTIRIKSLNIARPSIRAMPPSMVWNLNANKKFGDDDFNPFGKGGVLKDDIKAETEGTDSEFSESEQAIQDILETSKGRVDTRLGQNANVMMIAGFLDSFKKFLPSEHRVNTFWDLSLRQHEQAQKNVPVRVYTPDMKGLGSKLKRGLPVAITSQVRVKVTPNDDKDGQPEGVVYLRTDDVQAANRVQDILAVPAWYTIMVNEQKELRKKQTASMMERAAKQAESTPEAGDVDEQRKAMMAKINQ